MAFSMRDAAQISLVASRAAARSGHTFHLDQNKMKLMGFDADQIEDINQTVRDIEGYTERALAALDDQQSAGTETTP